MSLPNILRFTKTYNLTPQQLREHITSYHNLHESVSKTLRQYKLLCWNKELLQHKLAESGGSTIRRFDIEFQVCWNSLEFPTARSLFVSSPLDSQWWLSFRQPHPDSGLLPVVFISSKKRGTQ